MNNGPPVFLAPESLKDEANELYKQRKYTEAVELWKKALTIVLKQSMKGATQESIDLQTTLRLNIAQGLIMDEDYILAKEHLLIVLEREPLNRKALYRLAVVYKSIQDFHKAIGIARRGIEILDDDAFRILYNEVVKAEIAAREESKLKGPVLTFENYKDQRSAEPEPEAGAAIFSDEPTSAELNDNCDRMIAWKFKEEPSDEPTKLQQIQQVDADIDDWTSGNRWLSPYTTERLKDDRTVTNVALPFSILYGLDLLLRLGKTPLCQSLIEDLSTKRRIALPKLTHLIKEEARAPPSNAELANLLTLLGGAGNNLRPFNIHILNARGDDEVEVHWSSLLERIPNLSLLQLLLIGFNKPEDPYSRTIQAEDYFSPTLTKSVAGGDRKVACRLFKGNYIQFLSSEAVKKAAKCDTDILKDKSHILHPNLVIIPQCNLSRNFEEYVPIISRLLLSDVWILFLGHSSCEFPSHEALQLPAVLTALKASFVSDIYWNPFMIPVKPDDDFPEMSVKTQEGNIIENYKGLSAKYAIGLWVKGCQDMDLLLKLIDSEEEIRLCQEKLRSDGIDVDRESTAIRQLMQSDEYMTKARQLLKEQEDLIKEKSASFAASLQAKLAATPTKIS